jgi:hypothetical protein
MHVPSADATGTSVLASGTVPTTFGKTSFKEDSAPDLMLSPKDLEESMSVIWEAMQDGEPSCGPSTPSPPREPSLPRETRPRAPMSASPPRWGRRSSNTCRNRVRDSREPRKSQPEPVKEDQIDIEQCKRSFRSFLDK